MGKALKPPHKEVSYNHRGVTLKPGDVYCSVVHRSEYSTARVEGPWRLNKFYFIETMLVLEVYFIDMRWTCSLALEGDTWHREILTDVQ